MRVPRFPALPVDMDGLLRQSLSKVFADHADQINWTAYESTAVAAATTVAHDLVTVDATAATVTVTLIKAADWRDREVRVKKTSVNNTVIVHAQSGELIDGTASQTVSALYGTMRLYSDGRQWWKV